MHRLHRLTLLALSMLALLMAALPSFPPSAAIAQTSASPPQRSTAYSGSGSRVSYAHRAEFAIPGAMTIEAWVYRNDSSRCEAILSNDFTSSYWLGFCPRLRFYRLGGESRDASRDVPAGQWTHVAASYDGSTVRFYIDGEAAGTAALSHSGTPPANPLLLGADPNAGPTLGRNYNFAGALDEVRLWSIARTQAEIQAGMYREVDGGSGLVAVFGNGGNYEDLRGVPGTTVGEAVPQINGILPRDLVVPMATILPTLDGTINLATEYNGAEQIVLRYYNGTRARDTIGYLVHTTNRLYIGIPLVEFTDADPSTSWIGVMLDPNYSRDPLAQPSDIQIRIPVAGGSPTWMIGDGIGGWVAPATPPEHGPAGPWEVARANCSSEFAPDCIELRISYSQLGDWSGIDGLALGHFQLALGETTGDYLAPADAVANAPDTWAATTYSSEGASGTQAYITGYVNDVALATRPVAGHPVYLKQNGTILYSTTTGHDGRFSFVNRPVLADQPITIEIPDCADCRFDQASVSGTTNTPPTALSTLSATFPGCASDLCSYREITFRMYRPIGDISIGGYTKEDGTPTSGGVAPVLVRSSPPLSIPEQGDLIRITGSNLHPFMEVFLFNDSPSCREQPWGDSCERHSVPIRARANDGTSILVQIPPASFNRSWVWGLHDTWSRPGNVASTRDSWKFGPSFTIMVPEFPLLHGFGFENEADSPGIDEFLAVYGQNAYYCLGIQDGSTCAGIRQPNPLYWSFWFGVFWTWIDGSGGSCVGMAATSLLMQRGDLRPSSFNPAVLYPSGFTEVGKPSNFAYDTPLGALLGPPRAANHWAEIRKNHGIQTSAEFLAPSTSDIANGPTAVLNKIRANPRSWVVCVRRGGSGHCVSPYEVTDTSATTSTIRIYDNNYPLDTTRTIEIDRVNDRYVFRLDDERVWNEQWISAIPISVWLRPRTAPVDRPDLVFTAVFGGADALYTTPDGGRWGWEADGTPVEALPGAVPVPPFGQAPESNRNVALALPAGSPASTVQVNARGGDYRFFAAQGGNAAQLIARGVAAGDQDQIALSYEPGQLSGFQFTPQQTTNNLIPRIAMQLGDKASAVFTWRDLAVAGAGTVGFTALDDQRGVAYTNTTGSTTRHLLTLEMVDSESGNVANYTFGPFEVPSGATHRTVIGDWPTGRVLRSELDHDGDGVFESTTTAPGQPCAPQDLDGDGFAETCASGGGQSQVFLPFIRR